MKENLYPKYIDNKPTGVDQFNGKAHERISKSIANHIKENNNFLRVIGIEGEWGSGKSNIIELLRLILTDTHHIYIYDAWGHQEDSQRRAFLEELTEELIQKNILFKKTIWEEKIKLLLARKREVNKKTIPKLSIGIIIVGIVLILTPIFSIVSDILFDKNTIWWERILLPLTPILISFMTYLVSSARNWKWIKLSELFFIFKGKELENTTYETFSDLTPSVKEFKDWIRSISEGLSNKNLIIVFDNMDRLPPEKVKELWSSIHTFFAEEEYNKIDVLIPFDRKHLEKAFNSENNQTNEFINKTFSIIYRVTPPVLTDWKDFFKRKFIEAFGEKEENEFTSVLSIFDRLKGKFTPRDIIIFINELVTIKKIWGDEIPLRYIGVFTLRKDIILAQPKENILNNEYLGLAGDLFSELDELQNYISALTFNVPVEQASQVLLIRDLELTLRGEGSVSILDLSEHSHFVEILEEVIRSSDIIVDKAVLALQNLDISKLKGYHVIGRVEKIWDILVFKKCSQKISKISVSEVFYSLLNNSSNGSKINLLKHLVTNFNQLEDIIGRDYFLAVKELEEYVEQNEINFNILDHLTLKQVSPEVFINYLSVAKSDYKRFKLMTNSSELDNFIADKCPDDLNALETTVDLSYILDEYSFQITERCIEGLFKEDSLDENNFDNIISVYKSVSKDKPVKEIINVLPLYKLLNSVSEENEEYYDLISMRIRYAETYSIKISQQGWQDNTIEILDNTEEINVKKIATRIEHFMTYGDLLLLSTEWDQPLLFAVCKDLTFNKYGTQKLNITSVLQKFEEIINAIDVTAEELLNQLNRWSKNAENSINKTNVDQVIQNYSFYNHSSSISNVLTEHINSVALEYFKSLDDGTILDEWDDDDSYIFNSLLILIESNKIKTIPRNISSALKTILKKISESEFDIPDTGTMWHRLTEMSKNTKIAPTIRNIRDYYTRANNITPAHFLFFEEFFRSYGNFDEKSSDVTRTILGRVVANDSCFKLILNNQEFYIPIIKSAKEDAADFKDNVENRIDNEPENGELRAFAFKIGIKITDSKEEKSKDV